jgi:hypothetical protein
LGPAAHYFRYGQWLTPQMDYFWREGQVPFSSAPGFPRPGFPTPYDPWGVTQLSPEEELIYLKEEAARLVDELGAIERRIKELEQAEEKGEEK